MKRVFDILGALLGIALLAAVTPFVGAAIVLESGFPVFVALERVSGGKRIRVFKFRSMVRGAHAMKCGLQPLNERKDGPLFKIKNDPRLTRVGKVLRKFRIDEFPQFVNVLMGDLSMVGPRPHEPGELAQYPKEFKSLSLARAGLTGLSQVSGASSLPFKKELEFDKYYVEHRSLLLDASILFRTVWILFFDPTGV